MTLLSGANGALNLVVIYCCFGIFMGQHYFMIPQLLREIMKGRRFFFATMLIVLKRKYYEQIRTKGS